MVGGLATLGLVPLRPRQSIDLYSLVIWFALYKLGIFALVTVHPRRTRRVAHEVGNPIAAIELTAELLQDIVRAHPGTDMDEAGGLVAAIRDQVNTLDAITEEYLAFARFPKPHFEEESINHLIEELAAFVRPVAMRQGLTIHVSTDPTVPMMEIDRGLLRQAVHNLVKNGMEALSRGGALTIESRCDGDTVQVSVS